MKVLKIHKTKVLILIMLMFSAPILFSQEIRKIGAEELKAIINNKVDKLHVINFWATWCGPCVTELPYFQKISKEYPTEKVEFTFISLDFPSQAETKLIPFLKNRNYSLNVLLITELDYDLWLRDVDPEWQGNIPATLFYNNSDKKRLFVNDPMDDIELRTIINNML